MPDSSPAAETSSAEDVPWLAPLPENEHGPYIMPGESQDGTPRVSSGIPGFDELLGGGYPRGRAMLASGSAGSGKTLTSIHFVSDGAAADDEAAVFVSFEETAAQLRQTFKSLGKDAEALEEAGKLRFVTAVPETPNGVSPSKVDIVLGPFDLGGLISRIRAAAKSIGAKRVALDTLAGLAAAFQGISDDGSMVSDVNLRPALQGLVRELKNDGLTLLLTAEQTRSEGLISRFGLEEFVADGVVLLRLNQHGERRRRTIEILKLRSCAHAAGENPVVIRPGKGMAVLPLSAMRLTQQSGTERTTSGVAELDRMAKGGLLRDAVVLVSGATGTGKTLLCNHFAAGGVTCGDKVLFLAFEESREQILRNAEAFGFDLKGGDAEEKLVLASLYPEAISLEEHLLRIQELVQRHEPNRLVIDSLSALERVGPPFAFRQFMIGLAAFVKRNRVTTLLTAGGGTFGDVVQISEQHISTINDTIILLRYVDTQGRVERSLTLLKMRGSAHAREHRRYRIGSDGMELAGPRGDAGLLDAAAGSKPDPSARPAASEKNC